MKNIFALILILLLILTLPACSINFNTGGQTSPTNDGGVYKSLNKGASWQQKALIPTTSGKPRSIAGINVLTLALDPSDNQAVYLGSLENGLFYSYDGAENWQIATGPGKVSVKAIAIDPKNKCQIYAAAGNKLFKSVDCNRNWSVIYFDNDLRVSLNTVAIDSAKSNNLYLGTSRGEIIKSADGGTSWQTLQRFNNLVRKIIISPADSKVIFVATEFRGVFRTTDGGSNWTNISEKIKEVKDYSFRDLVVSKSQPSLIIMAIYTGIFKSQDNGESWEKVELITPEKQATINSVCLNPQDSQEIYYVTKTTFYHSLNGGKDWITKKLPTSRAGWVILGDPDNTNTLYLGVKLLK